MRIIVEQAFETRKRAFLAVPRIVPKLTLIEAKRGVQLEVSENAPFAGNYG